VKARDVLDNAGFYVAISWIVMALLVFWLFHLNKRVDDSVKVTRVAVRSNTDAIAFLCQTNAIVQALAEQTVALLKSQPPTPERKVTIQVFEGYAKLLNRRRPCVKAERAALP
jgi:hypothetical protein